MLWLMLGCCFAVQDGEGGPGGESTPAAECTPPLGPAAHHAPHLQVSSAVPSLLCLVSSQQSLAWERFPQLSQGWAGLQQHRILSFPRQQWLLWGAHPGVQLLGALPAPQQGQQDRALMPRGYLLFLQCPPALNTPCQCPSEVPFSPSEHRAAGYAQNSLLLP